MGRHLCLALRRQGGCEVLEFDVRHAPENLPVLAARADLVFHLAGVNRPKEEKEFTDGNASLTRRLCDCLAKTGRQTPLALSSSIQAEAGQPLWPQQEGGGRRRAGLSSADWRSGLYLQVPQCVW